MSDTSFEDILKATINALPTSDDPNSIVSIEQYVGSSRKQIEKIVQKQADPLQILLANPNLVDRKTLEHVIGMALMYAVAPHVHLAHEEHHKGRERQILKSVVDEISGQHLQGAIQIEATLRDFVDDPTSSDILDIATDLYSITEDLQGIRPSPLDLIRRINVLGNFIAKDPQAFHDAIVEQFEAEKATRFGM